MKLMFNSKFLVIIPFTLSLLFVNISFCQNSIPNKNKATQITTISKFLSSGAFAPFSGGDIDFYNGCFVNRLNGGLGNDGNMYANVDIPVGATILSVTAHFFDMARSIDNRPKIILRQHTGQGIVTELAVVQLPFSPTDFPGYYEQSTSISPGYIVQNNDFLDLIFIAGGSAVINAYYICGVEIFYQLNPIGLNG